MGWYILSTLGKSIASVLMAALFVYFLPYECCSACKTIPRKVALIMFMLALLTIFFNAF